MNTIAPVDFAAIFTEYQPKIYRYVYRRTSDHYVAEDLTADVFVRAIDSTQRNAGCQESFLPWLYRIAHNLIIDYYRACIYRRHLSTDDVLHIPDPDANPVWVAERAMEAEIIQDAMKVLTPLETEVIRLRFFDGLSFEEISNTIGKNVGATKQYRLRAIDKLQEYYAGGKPAKEKKEPPEKIGVDSKTEVYNALLEHGPLTTTALMDLLRSTYDSVDKILKRNKPLFWVVSTVPGMTTNAPRRGVWGLVGIHQAKEQEL